MGVQVMQSELIDQRLLDFLVQDKKTIGVDRAPAELEVPRHMAVDVDGLAVEAVAREIGDVVLAIEFLHPPADCVERAIHHQAGDVPLREPQLLVGGGRMTEVEWHGFKS
jgi:hypothetical protein